MTEEDLREVETLLRDAAAKAEAACAMLDLELAPCGDCNRLLARDLTHYRVYERIGPVAGKLRVAASRLRHAHEGKLKVPGCPHCRAAALRESGGPVL